MVSRLRGVADTLGAGAMLPTERSLADEWAVARSNPVEYAEAVLPADRYQLRFPPAAGPDGRLTAAPDAQ